MKLMKDHKSEQLTILDTPIIDLYPSVRLWNRCKSVGIENVRDVLRADKWKLIRNFGKKNLRELEDILNNYGIQWKVF